MKRVYSWGDVPAESVENFRVAVDKLRRKMIPTDCDNDYAVEFIIVDRRHYERMQYFLTPYMDKDRKGYITREEVLITNVKIAIEALDTELRIKKFK